MTWAVIQRCGGQIRIVGQRVFALDFGAVFALADAMGAHSALLADVLPEVEPIIVGAFQTGGD